MTKKYEYNLQTFYNEDAVSYYLLGVFMTDGCVRQGNTGSSFSITSKDKDWLDLINNYISPNKLIRFRENRNCYEQVYHNNDIVKWFINKGCIPQKSLTLKFPEVPKEYLFDFIRGCWDGDGSISFGKTYRKDRDTYEIKRQCAIYTSSIDFANGFVEILQRLNFNPFIYIRKFGLRKIVDHYTSSERENYRIAFKNGEEICRFLKLIYPKNNVLSMPRKFKIAQELIADWEKPYFCEQCGVQIQVAKTARSTKFCKECSVKRSSRKLKV